MKSNRGGQLLKDITGCVFGRWTVLRRGGDYPSKKAYWLCRCKCGVERDVEGKSLRNGSSKSCGCLKADISRGNVRTRCVTHGDTDSTEFRAWTGCKTRCYNKNSKNYAEYGGRGIEVCSRWLDSYDNFLTDMGRCPQGCSLDRIDVNGNYEPGNCRWATAIQQQNNRRSNIRLEHNGKSQTIAEWARELGVSYGTLYQRRTRGLSVADILRV